MRYLFHTSNSINDFIDPALSRILSRSQANEMGNQAISWGWQRGGFSLSKVLHKSHLSLPAGVRANGELAFGFWRGGWAAAFTRLPPETLVPYSHQQQQTCQRQCKMLSSHRSFP